MSDTPTTPDAAAIEAAVMNLKRATIRVRDGEPWPNSYGDGWDSACLAAMIVIRPLVAALVADRDRLAGEVEVLRARNDELDRIIARTIPIVDFEADGTPFIHDVTQLPAPAMREVQP